MMKGAGGAGSKCGTGVRRRRWFRSGTRSTQARTRGRTIEFAARIGVNRRLRPAATRLETRLPGPRPDGAKLQPVWPMPVARVHVESGAETGHDATALRDKSHELEIRQARDQIEGRAEFFPQRRDERGVLRRFARERMGGTGERDPAAGEGLADFGFILG